VFSSSGTDSSVFDALIGVPGALPSPHVAHQYRGQRSTHSRFSERRGAIPSLETFIWDTIRIPDTHPLAFLQSNSPALKAQLCLRNLALPSRHMPASPPFPLLHTPDVPQPLLDRPLHLLCRHSTTQHPNQPPVKHRHRIRLAPRLEPEL
jgi:hypothetical protein